MAWKIIGTTITYQKNTCVCYTTYSLLKHSTSQLFSGLEHRKITLLWLVKCRNEYDKINLTTSDFNRTCLVYLKAGS